MNGVGERLTRRQREALDYIRQQKIPPSIREISSAMGLSKLGAAQHVNRLVRKGYIRRGKGARAIAAVATATLPVAGTVDAAGMISWAKAR